MDKLAAAITILSQGMPFIQLGQDFLRTKPRILDENEKPNDVNVFSHDSYNAPDLTNSIKWDTGKLKHLDVFKYYKALIALRKNSPLFRLSSKEEVNAHLRFNDTGDYNFISFILENENDCYVVAFNPYYEERHFRLPEGRFFVRLDENGMKNSFEQIMWDGKCPPLSAVVYKRFKNK